jgi:DNA-binding transcriptional ArsR family regulator
MARSATTTDVFSAIAEPRRRQVLGTLIGGEKAVADIVDILGWPQPQVSKHLAVLRAVGLVNVRQLGRQRLYVVNGPRLKPIHDWVRMYEQFWSHQLDRIKQRAERAAAQARRRNH